METQGNRKLILNFENVRFLSSAPIGMLVNLMKQSRLSRRRGKVLPASIQTSKRSCVSREVEGLFSIFANEQDARDSFLSL